MTAVRDRKSDPDVADKAAVPWDRRAAFGSFRGLPWWGATLLAFVVALAAAVADLQISDSVGLVFQVTYGVGCLVAVVFVQRRNLFGPMVQPPLVLAIAVPLIVVTASGLPEGSDTLATALAVGTPLINAFPAMAITTGVTVCVGIARTYREKDPDRQEKSPSRRDRDGDPPGKKRPAKGDGGPGKDAGRDAGKAKDKRKDQRSRKDEAAKTGKGKGEREAAEPTMKTSSPDDQDRPAGRGPTRREPEGRGAAGRTGGPPRRPDQGDGGARPGPDSPPGRGGPPPPRGPRTGPDNAERRRRAEEWPDSIPAPKRPRRTPPPAEPPDPPGPQGRRGPGPTDRQDRQDRQGRPRPWDQ